jgi:hypothetical protein
MKIRTLLGLTVIGSAVYAHKRHGGEFTVASMQNSLRDLWAGIRGEASDARPQAGLTDDSRDPARQGAGSARSGSVAGANDARGPGSSQPPALPGPVRSATHEEPRDNSISPLPGGLGRNR